MASYLQAPGEPAGPYRAFAVGVLRVEGGRIAEMVAFHDPGLFASFGLPDVLPDVLP
jgi:RNA polymerase sigma-70 factor (ECF subfamily)